MAASSLRRRSITLTLIVCDADHSHFAAGAFDDDEFLLHDVADVLRQDPQWPHLLYPCPELRELCGDNALAGARLLLVWLVMCVRCCFDGPGVLLQRAGGAQVLGARRCSPL